MIDKDRYQRTFGLLHASGDFLKEVPTMRPKHHFPIRKITVLCAAVLLLFSMASVCYAENIGGIRRTIQLWIHGDQTSAVTLTGAAAVSNYREGADPVEMAVRGRIQYLSEEELNAEVEQSKSAQEIMKESECQTCKERKYQDGSNDPGVSFKTPTNVAPEQAAAAVRGH